MMTLEQSMSALIQAGLATYDDAVARSLYPKDIELAPRSRIGVA
jgi:twitching motility protein PilT